MTGSASVATETRERVEAAIEALQFVPSSAARAINSGRTRLIGALIPTLDHAIFARFIDHVETTLDTRGLSLIVANTRSDTEQELAKARKLLDLGVEALLVSGTTRAEGFGALVTRYGVPVVATSCFDPGYTYPTIGYDNFEVARSALLHLLSLGHQRIAVLSGPAHNNDRTRARLGGIRSIAGPDVHVEETELSFDGARAGLNAARQAVPDLTAVLCLSDVLAQGALLELRRAGQGGAAPLSVMGMDDLPTSEHFDPPLSTVRLPVGRMGEAAAHAIANWVELGTTPSPMQIETRLVPRASTAALGT